MSAGRQLFIYYRLASVEVPAACAAVRQAQQALCERHPGLQARLLQRPETGANGERTLMEVYAMDASVEPAGVSTALQSAIADQLGGALQSWLSPDARHTEVFIDLPCAS